VTLKRVLRKIYSNLISLPKLIFGFGIKQYDQIISGQIREDEFSKQIKLITSDKSNSFFVEIGSSAGGGSTKQFVDSLLEREDRDLCLIVCFEASAPRSIALKNLYGDYKFVKIYNQSSVRLDEYPSYRSIVSFYLKTKSNMHRYGLLVVLSWLRVEKKYLRKNGLGFTSGLESMKNEFGEDPDVVLIDGSEFTGEVELNYLSSAKYILLDDINSFKNFGNFEKLNNSTSHQIISLDKSLRNGYAIFKKIQ